MSDSTIFKQLRGALEFARFSSPEIRDAVNTCITEMIRDMDEVEYEMDGSTKIAFKNLNAAISEFENSEADTSAEPLKEHEIDPREEEVVEEFVVKDEVERVISASSKVSVPDDDDIDL